MEGVSYREIERLLGVSHVTVFELGEKIWRQGPVTCWVSSDLSNSEPYGISQIGRK